MLELANSCMNCINQHTTTDKEPCRSCTGAYHVDVTKRYSNWSEGIKYEG